MIKKLLLLALLLPIILIGIGTNAQTLPTTPAPVPPPPAGLGSGTRSSSGSEFDSQETTPDTTIIPFPTDSTDSNPVFTVTTDPTTTIQTPLPETTAVRTGGLSILLILLIPVVMLFLIYYYRIKAGSSPLNTREKKIATHK